MNKRIFILAITVLLAMGQMFAQVKVDRSYGWSSDNSGRESMRNHGSALVIKYGGKVGVNLSNISNDMSFDPNFSLGVGFQIGGLVNFHWGQRTASSLPGTGLWGLQPEIQFSHNSIKSDGGDVKLNYLTVPVMLKVYPLSSLSFEVGPEFAYLISTSPKSITMNEATIKTGDCKGFNMGIGVGASYEFDCGFLIGARYTAYFNDLAKNLKWKNNTNIQISMGWLF